MWWNRKSPKRDAKAEEYEKRRFFPDYNGILSNIL